MKLLFCVDSLESGGAQRQLVSLASGLTDKQHEVEIFIYMPRLPHFQPLLDKAGVRVRTIDKQCRFSMRPILALRRLLTQVRYDAALAFLDTPSFYGEMASLFLPVPLVVSERSAYKTVRPAKRLLLSLHRLADRITVNSHHHRERLVKDFPWMADRISTIYNGVDLKRFRRRTDCTPESPRLLAVGRLTESKNALVIAEALILHHERHGYCPHVDWIGKIQDIAYRDRCNNVLRQAGLSQYWQWVGERTDLDQVYSAYDGLIHPSLIEGLANVVCESMACEVPVLVGRIGDHERFITDGKSGLLFDASSMESVYSSIHRFLGLTPGERLEMGRQGRLIAEREFSVERYVEEYESLLLRVSRRGRG